MARSGKQTPSPLHDRVVRHRSTQSSRKGLSYTSVELHKKAIRSGVKINQRNTEKILIVILAAIAILSLTFLLMR